MTDELKPCPFCGKEAYIFTDDGGQFPDDGVTCSECLCELRASTPEEWNTRPIEDGLRAEIALLREALGQKTKSKIIGTWVTDDPAAVVKSGFIMTMEDEEDE